MRRRPAVTGKIVEQGRAKKLTVLKFKKTNQYKIQRGHRQNYTAVQVSEIKPVNHREELSHGT